MNVRHDGRTGLGSPSKKVRRLEAPNAAFVLYAGGGAGTVTQAAALTAAQIAVAQSGMLDGSSPPAWGDLDQGIIDDFNRYLATSNAGVEIGESLRTYEPPTFEACTRCHALNNFGFTPPDGDSWRPIINPDTGQVLPKYAHQVDRFQNFSDVVLDMVAMEFTFNVGAQGVRALQAWREAAALVKGGANSADGSATASRVFSDTRVSWPATRPQGTLYTYDVIQRSNSDWLRVHRWRSKSNRDDK